MSKVDSAQCVDFEQVCRFSKSEVLAMMVHSLEWSVHAFVINS